MRTILIITQVYAPDPAAVGQHFADVAEQLVRRGYRVVVLTSRRGYDDPCQKYSWREHLRGVRVRRLPFSSFGKRSIAIRLIAQWLFLIQAVMCGLVVRGLEAVFVSTSPPFAGFGGYIVSWIRARPLVWWVMDLNPDQLVAAGLVSARSLFVRAFDWMNRVVLDRATAVIVLDRFMRDRILRKRDVGEKIWVIPPWSAHSPGVGVPHETNPFRRRLGLDHARVVMYAGNAGLSSPLHNLLEAASELHDKSRLEFVFIGGGVGKRQVDALLTQRPSTNVASLPYQPADELPFVLSAADVHVVSLADDAVGIVHPCKVYGALAAGRPVLAIAPKESYLAEILAHGGIGWLVPQDDIASLLETLNEISDLPPATLKEMGDAAGRIAAAYYNRHVAIDAVCSVVECMCKVGYA